MQKNHFPLHHHHSSILLTPLSLSPHFFPCKFSKSDRIAHFTVHKHQKTIPIFFPFSLSLILSLSMAFKFRALSLFCNLLLLQAFSATSTIDQDRADCSDKLIGLAPCLPYVSGDAKTPTIDCCSGLKLVVQQSKKCLCVLIKDKDDPNLGLKINGTLALGLPGACHAPANITECISLLHLPPNSTEAKIFKESNHTNGPSSVPDAKVNGNSSSASEKSDGGIGRRSIGGVGMALEILLGFFILSHLNLKFIHPNP